MTENGPDGIKVKSYLRYLKMMMINIYKQIKSMSEVIYVLNKFDTTKDIRMFFTIKEYF